MRIPVSLPVEKKSGFVTDWPQLFPPNATTRTLAMTSSELTETGMEVLDLGCGSGIIGLHIAHSLKEQSGEILNLSMSDVSEVATQIASQNAEALGIPAEVRQGWVLEPWQGRKFDLIVADISAVVPVVAKLTNWFNGAPNESGDDGTALATETLSRAGFFLNAGGRILIPVLSVSNESAIIATMSHFFDECEVVAKIKLPIGPLTSVEKASFELDPHVRLENINGVNTFEVTIYCLRFPRGKNVS